MDKDDKFIDFLNNLSDKVYMKFPSINCGGCCVVASIIGKHLQRQGFKVRLVVIDYDADVSLNEARKYVKENSLHDWHNNGIGFYHVYLEFKYKNRWYFWDAEYHCDYSKNYSLGGLQKYSGYLTLLEAEQLAADNAWNPEFNRADIPNLKRLITKYFNSNLSIAA